MCLKNDERITLARSEDLPGGILKEYSWNLRKVL